jgi:hypothetical protein
MNNLMKNLPVPNNKKVLKRKEENSDHFLIVLTIMNGKRKIDFNKAKKYILLQVDILIFKRL